MQPRHPSLPDIWLISDARNDSRLEETIDRLPKSSGLIYRHYHLQPAERRARFDALALRARARGHILVLAGPPRQAREWGADGAYGPASRIAHGPALLRLATAHSLREIGQALRLRADAILLSPVFPTRSHPGEKSLGQVRFRLMAGRARVPIIALGGMTSPRASNLGVKKWAAIDGI